MSPAAIGAVVGVILAVALGLGLTQGGAGVALLVPVFAIVLGLLGAALGWCVGRIVRMTR